MNEAGFLRKSGPSYEFHYPEHNLIVRGSYVEWVLEAAAEIIARTERLKSDGHIEEIKTLAEFGEADEVDVDSAQFDANARFEIIPQCIVSMGSMDYRWVSAAGRKGDASSAEQPITRIHDMSMTRNDTFLANVEGVDTTAKP